MANYQVLGTLEYQDSNGERAVTQIPLGPQADTTLLSDMAGWLVGAGSYADLIGTPGQHLTNAKLVRAAVEVVFIKAHISGGTPPADAAFPSVQDKLVLGFAANDGTQTRVSIPAPKDALMLPPPSDYTADKANTALAAFLTLATAGGTGLMALTNPGGTVYGFANGGRKVQRIRKRRGATDYITSTHVMS